MALGRQVGTVGLDYQALGRHEARDVGQRARVGIRHGPRQRDREPEVEAAPGDGHVAREAVHDPADLAHAGLAEDHERLLVGITAVDEHGLAHTPGELEHPPQRPLLRVARGEVAEEVEPDLADGDHARLAGQPLDLRERRLVGLGRVVRVDADRGPHARVLGGHRDGRLLGTAACFETQELSLQIAILLARRAPGGLQQHRLEPWCALFDPRRAALAGALATSRLMHRSERQSRGRR